MLACRKLRKRDTDDGTSLRSKRNVVIAAGSSLAIEHVARASFEQRKLIRLFEQTVEFPMLVGGECTLRILREQFVQACVTSRREETIGQRLKLPNAQTPQNFQVFTHDLM
jgi:hypothetical protein